MFMKLVGFVGDQGGKDLCIIRSIPRNQGLNEGRLTCEGGKSLFGLLKSKIYSSKVDFMAKLSLLMANILTFPPSSSEKLEVMLDN